MTKVDGADAWSYEWNAEGLLSRVTKNGLEVARHKYDALGRRVEKVVGGTATTYTYDGEDIFQQIGGGFTTRFIHGPGIDEPLGLDLAGTFYVAHADTLGSVYKLTSATGAVGFSQTFDAFGNPQIATVGGHSFTGREWDPETGLYYYRARYYDPKIGRFISEDPIGFGGGINFYAYAYNRPTTLIDPFGLESGNINQGFQGPYAPLTPFPPSGPRVSHRSTRFSISTETTT
jgi:RHS repeat-associated protein